MHFLLDTGAMIREDAYMSTLTTTLNEQDFQNQYCLFYGLPRMKQRNPGIDYYCAEVGWIEFIRDGKPEGKDYEYASQANNEPYKIVSEVPFTQSAITMLTRLGIGFEVWKPKYDNLRVVLGILGLESIEIACTISARAKECVDNIVQFEGDFITSISVLEKEMLAFALDKAQGNRTKAAESLGMTYRSFRHYAKKYRM